MSKKYQVFISSTYRDLEIERRAVTQAVLDLGQIPSGMETFPAFDEEQFVYIKKMIDDSDYYIIIVGARYGQVDDSGVSFTEKEFDYARASGKAVLAFIHEQPDDLPVKHSEVDPKVIASLSAFRAKLKTGRLVKFWISIETLSTAVLSSLAVAMTQAPQVGWIRGSAVASEDLLARLEHIRAENDELKAALVELRVEYLSADDYEFLSREVYLNFTWTTYEHGSSRKHSSQLSLAWSEIVIAVCPGLYQPATIAKVGSLVQTFISERKGKRVMQLVNNDEQLIKINLEHIGVIQSYQAASTAGGVYEYLTTTKKGKAACRELIVAR